MGKRGRRGHRHRVFSGSGSRKTRLKVDLGAPVAEWLEGALSMREVSGSILDQSKYKNLCGGREPSDCVGFRRIVKRQRFHTLKLTT